MIDGNTAALMEEERRRDAQDQAYERFLVQVEPMLKAINEASKQAYDLADSFEDKYDFAEDLTTLIQEEL